MYIRGSQFICGYIYVVHRAESSISISLSPGHPATDRNGIGYMKCVRVASLSSWEGDGKREPLTSGVFVCDVCDVCTHLLSRLSIMYSALPSRLTRNQCLFADSPLTSLSLFVSWRHGRHNFKL